MKTRILSFAAAAAVAGLLSSSLFAADDIWVGGHSTAIDDAQNYATPANFSLGANRQVFSESTNTSVTVPTANTQVLNTAFLGAAGNYVFSGQQIQFTQNGGILFNLVGLSGTNGGLTTTPTITVNNNILDFNGRASTAALSFYNTSPGATLIVNGNIASGGINGQSENLAIKQSVASAGVATTVLNGILSDGTQGGNLVVTRTGGAGNGTSILTINGANTFTGGFEFGNGSGTLILGNASALGTGQFRMNEAGFTVQSNTALTGANAVANTINYVSGTFANGNTTTTAAVTFTAGNNTAQFTGGVAPAVGDFVGGGAGNFLTPYVRVTGVTGTTVTFDSNALTSGSGTLTTKAFTTSGQGTTIYGGTTDLQMAGTQNLTTLYSNGAAATQTFNVTNTGLTTFSGVLEQQGGVASIAKIGVGRLVLSGNNTYGGTTAVNAGTLFVNNTAGSGTGAGAVSVAANATLAGTGTVAGAVGTVASSNIAPGFATIGTLSVGSMTLAGNLLEELSGATSDKLADAGPLTLTGTSALNLATLATPTAPLYTLATFTSLTGTFGTVTGTPSGYTLNYLPTAITLTANAVPEPATLGAILGASSLLVRRRRAAK